MATFEVAHLSIHYVNVVIVFLGPTFDHQTQQQQKEHFAALQLCCTRQWLVARKESGYRQPSPMASQTLELGEIVACKYCK